MVTAIDESTESRIFLPDPPEETKDGLVFDLLARTGNAYFLNIYMGQLKTTVYNSRRYISPVVTTDPTGLFAPDLLIAFNVNPENFDERNGYVVSEQGKPPDFVMEIASHITGDLDVRVKPDAYAALGILEYWRFDPTGEYNGDFLAADQLVDGRYQPMPIEQLGEELWQGYSPVLDIHIQWEKVCQPFYRDKGMIEFYDSRTGLRLSTMTKELADYYTERARRLAAEARVRELEERLRGLGG